MIAAARVLNCGREAFWREGERTEGKHKDCER